MNFCRAGLFALFAASTLTVPAHADEALVAEHTSLWPMTLDFHLLVGAEPHGIRGTPVAFGIGAELYWKNRIGAFVALLGSEGTPIKAATENGMALASLADRISVPIALTVRPLSWLYRDDVAWHARFIGRLCDGISAQLGLSIEYLRTSDDSATTAGLHLGLGIDVPIWGGPERSGVALRIYGRFMAAPRVTLDNGAFEEPGYTEQIYGGLAFYP